MEYPDPQIRLESFERMKKAVEDEYASILRQMEDMKTAGKTGSATYRQLMGRKMNYKNIIDLYLIHDL